MIKDKVMEQTEILHKYFTEHDQEMLGVVYEIENSFDTVQPLLSKGRANCGACNGRLRNVRRPKGSTHCDKCGVEIDW